MDSSNLLTFFKKVPFELEFNNRESKSILKGFENEYWKLKVIENSLYGHFKDQFLFKLDFTADKLGIIFTHAHLNRNPLMYKGTNDLQDLVDIHWMILRYLLKRTFNKGDFQQRSVSLNPATARAYELNLGDEWPEADYKVKENDERNKVFAMGNQYYLITDMVPDPKKFWFIWFDGFYPRGGYWPRVFGRSDCWTEAARVKIYAFYDIK